MERANSQWVAHVRHRNGIEGAKRSIRIRSVRFIRKRFDKVASSGASRRYSSPSLRGAALEQVAIRSHRNFVVEVGALEPERPACLYNAGDDAIRCNEMISGPDSQSLYRPVRWMSWVLMPSLCSGIVSQSLCCRVLRVS